MRTLLILIVCGSCTLCSGCTMFEYIKPHQLWKLNRQPPIGRDDAYFNIPPEEIPTQTTEATPLKHRCVAF